MEGFTGIYGANALLPKAGDMQAQMDAAFAPLEVTGPKERSPEDPRQAEAFLKPEVPASASQFELKPQKEGRNSLLADVAAYFRNGERAQGIQNPGKWLRDMHTGNEHAQKALKAISHIGRNARFNAKNKPRKFRAHLPLFKLILSMSRDEMSRMPTSNQIRILDAFLAWNYLPATSTYFARWQSVEQHRLHKWQKNDFFHFAIASRYAPLPLSKAFIRSYKSALLEKFPELSLDNKLTILASEINHDRGYTSAEWQRLFTETHSHLRRRLARMSSERDRPRFISLKELFRATLYFRAKYPERLHSDIFLIESLIQEGLMAHGVSLKEGGRSLSKTAEAKASPETESIIAFLQWKYPGAKIFLEYYNLEQGIFDPVDIFMITARGQKVVIESQTPEHYFQTLSSNGSVGRKHILRVTDRTRLTINKYHGIASVHFKTFTQENLAELFADIETSGN